MFNIQDYISRFDVVRVFPSQYTCICPLCSGKLQISRNKEGAYKCFGEGCSSDEIREWLGVKGNKDRYFNPVFRRVITPILVKSGKIMLVEKPLTTSFQETIETKEYVSSYQLYKQRRFVRQKKITHIRYTFYYYSDVFRVVRIDFFKKAERVEKMFFPEFKTDVWQSSSQFHSDFKIKNDCFYNFKFLDTTAKDLVLLVVEGEKCCDSLASLGIIAVTPPGYGWSQNWIKEKLYQTQHLFSGVIIVPDNDDPGRNKAKVFQEQAWKLEIPCSIIEIDDEKDVSDFIEKNPELFFQTFASRLLDIGVEIERTKKI